MTIYIKDAKPSMRVFVETLSQTPLYDQALSLGLINVYHWCVARALFEVYLLDICEQSHNSNSYQYQKFYDQVHTKLIHAMGDEFEVMLKFINKRVGISHKDSDIVLYSMP